jgi:hypothetical protein
LGGDEERGTGSSGINKRYDKGRGTFSSLGWESGWVIGSWATGTIAGGELGGIEHVLTDEAIVAAREGVHIGHHAGWAVDDSEVVTE